MNNMCAGFVRTFFYKELGHINISYPYVFVA